MRRWLPAATGIAVLAAMVGALELASRSGLMSPFLVPPPSAIASAGWHLSLTPRLADAFFTTLLVSVAATFAAALVGIPAGWLMHRFRDYGGAYVSWVGALFSAPLILLYPLFLVLFGRTLFTIGFMGFCAGMIPVLLKTYEGLGSVPKVLVNVARSFNLRDRDIFFKVQLPAALPSVFTGIRLTFIYTTINIVGLEYLANFGGLGFLVGDLYDRFNIPAMYSAVAFVLVVSMLGFAGAERLERLFAGPRHQRIEGQA